MADGIHWSFVCAGCKGWVIMQTLWFSRRLLSRLLLFDTACECTDSEGKRDPDTGHGDGESPLDVPQVLGWCGEFSVVDCGGG